MLWCYLKTEAIYLHPQSHRWCKVIYNPITYPLLVLDPDCHYIFPLTLSLSLSLSLSAYLHSTYHYLHLLYHIVNVYYTTKSSTDDWLVLQDDDLHSARNNHKAMRAHQGKGLHLPERQTPFQHDMALTSHREQNLKICPAVSKEGQSVHGAVLQAESFLGKPLPPLPLA